MLPTLPKSAALTSCTQADNEPTSYVIPYIINCTLPALYAASKNPDVDISVGIAHVGEVHAVKNMVTTLNWHSCESLVGGVDVVGGVGVFVASMHARERAGERRGAKHTTVTPHKGHRRCTQITGKRTARACTGRSSSSKST